MQNTAQQTAIFFGNAPIDGIAPYSVIEESLGAGGTLRQRMLGKIIHVSFGPWHAGLDFPERGYARDRMAEPPAVEEFAQSGIPADLGSDWLIPLHIVQLN
ncbi:MAG: hypothetical protein KF828_05400 [Anaerolineales bacterium]|nr:hypothetical protein [Anaerolineales bacterium]